MKYDLLMELKSCFGDSISLFENETLAIQEGLHLKPGNRSQILEYGINKAFSKEGMFHGRRQDVFFRYNGNNFSVFTRSDKGFFVLSSLNNEEFVLSSLFYTYTGAYYVSCSNISNHTSISYYENDAIDTFKRLTYHKKKFNPNNLDKEGIVPDKKIELDYCDNDLEDFIKYSLSDDSLRVDDYFQELLDTDLSKNKSNGSFLKKIIKKIR